ncbi:MFS transporter [Arthrobacter mobilis]|uniref:MFS transporter n=1 Tax=Arthrobacter mobilis TaxID=2724944 RepID=A0A7X6K654_9MICC|nr:MFS transporter [Arthrobacter mobilis]NKX55164.1 MFS transporter [Arthrobacter mobilis]
MTSRSGVRRASSGALLIAGVLLVAANLRHVLTAVGPLLGQIRADTGLGAAALGLLAAVPLLAFGVISPLAHGISGKFGVEKTVFAALLVLVAGTLLRPLPGSLAYLWLGTFIIGAAIAICNVLLPAILKRDFPERMASLTGTYSAVLGGAASLGAGLSVPLSLLPLPGGPAGWRFALAAYVLLILPAVLLWIPQLRRPRPGTPESPSVGPVAAVPGPARGAVWKSAVAWQVTWFMGLQSMSFYILITWLPTLERSYGRSEVGAGWDLFTFQLIGVAASLLTPLFLRGGDHRAAAALPPALVVAGVLGLMLLPGAMLLWVLLAGFGSGSSLVTALALFGLRTRTHREASALSGMAQSVGYLMAAAGPPLFGALYGATGGWVLPLVMLACAGVLQAVTGLAAGRDRFAFAATGADRPVVD